MSEGFWGAFLKGVDVLRGSIECPRAKFWFGGGLVSNLLDAMSDKLDPDIGCKTVLPLSLCFIDLQKT